MNEKKTHWAAATLATLTGLNLVNYLDRFLMPAMISPVEKELGLNDDQFATAVIAFMWGYFLTSPFFGYLGDRVSRKWLVAGGVLVWCLGTALSGTAHSLLSLVLFRVLVGFGEASYATISPGWIADLYPAARRNNALTIFYVATSVGTALGFILGGWMAVHFGWRAAFVCASAPGVALVVALVALPEPQRGASDAAGAATPAPAAGLRVYAELLRYKSYLLVVAGYVAQTFAMGGFAVWAPAFLERHHHMNFDDADHFFGRSLIVAGLISTLLGGFIATAWQRRHPAGYAWVLALSAALAAPVVLAVFLVPDAGLAKVALVASMFLLFLATGPVNTLIIETVPVAMRASAMAASIFAIHFFGDLWSPKIVGKLSVHFGNLQHAMVLTLPAAISVCAALWCWLAVRQTRAARSG